MIMAPNSKNITRYGTYPRLITVLTNLFVHVYVSVFCTDLQPTYVFCITVNHLTLAYKEFHNLQVYAFTHNYKKSLLVDRTVGHETSETFTLSHGRSLCS